MTDGSMGGPIARSDDFNEARWLRAGAGPRQLQKLREQFEALPYDERIRTNQTIASMPDTELAGHLKSLPTEGEAGTPSAEVAESLGDTGPIPPRSGEKPE